jgi:hypothetical protein
VIELLPIWALEARVGHGELELPAHIACDELELDELIGADAS